MSAPAGYSPEILDRARPVVVAVSGGADSVALLRLLVADGFDCRVLHVNHLLRGGESDRDEEFAKALAGRLGCVFRTRRERPEPERDVSLEMAARRLRLRTYAEAAEAEDAQGVALGHHRRDQVETVLMRLLRGATPLGFGGMHPVAEVRGARLLRPLLDAEPEALRAWLREIGQDWREDASNADPAFARNRIRHELLPLLRDLNAGAEAHIARLAELTRADNLGWETHTVPAWRQAEPPGLARPERATVPGPVDLPVPGEAAFGDWRITAELAEGFESVRDGMRAWIRPGAGPLRVRAWRDGDRMRPYGLGGGRKLQDILTDLRIPAAAKRVWPVVERDGRIVWLPGYRIDECAAVENGQSVCLRASTHRLPG